MYNIFIRFFIVLSGDTQRCSLPSATDPNPQTVAFRVLFYIILISVHPSIHIYVTVRLLRHFISRIPEDSELKFLSKTQIFRSKKLKKKVKINAIKRYGRFMYVFYFDNRG